VGTPLPNISENRRRIKSASGLHELREQGFGAADLDPVAVQLCLLEEQLHVGLPQLGRALGETPTHLGTELR